MITSVPSTWQFIRPFIPTALVFFQQSRVGGAMITLVSLLLRWETDLKDKLCLGFKSLPKALGRKKEGEKLLRMIGRFPFLPGPALYSV